MNLIRKREHFLWNFIAVKSILYTAFCQMTEYIDIALSDLVFFFELTKLGVRNQHQKTNMKSVYMNSFYFLGGFICFPNNKRIKQSLFHFVIANVDVEWTLVQKKKQDRSRRCKYIQSIDIENAEKTLACLTEYIYIALSDLVRFILGELR